MRITNADDELIALGLNETLATLDTKSIRSQLTFLEPSSHEGRKRAALILLKRIRQYYEVINYNGPYLTSFNAEIPEALGQLLCENNCTWRTSYIGTNQYHWKNPEKIFNDVRSMCAESALMLAEWEISKEVPESKEALYQARRTALNAIKDSTFSGLTWSKVRRRYRRAGFTKLLDTVLNTIEKNNTAIDEIFRKLTIVQ